MSFHHLIFILLSNLATLSYQQACKLQDEQSLLTFAGSVTSSFGPLDWNATANCCSSWEGIGCDSNGRVTRLWLPLRGLSGSVSPSLVNLTGLSQLNLSENALSGTVPNGLFTSLNSLEIIDLSNNLLHGNLSASFSSKGTFSATIRVIDISRNEFHGRVEPGWFGLGSNLTNLNVSSNEFTGQVPSSICAPCPLLRILDFSNNAFSTEIPGGIGICSKLKVFRAGFNALSGVLPGFNVSYNQLEGPIPTGGQFDTFEESSYVGIPGLCGRPLLQNLSCSVQPIPSTTCQPSHSITRNKDNFLDGFAVGAAVIFPVILAVQAYRLRKSLYRKKK